MRRPRRNHTAAFTAKVALAALKGDKTLPALAEKSDVHGSQIVQWKAQVLAGANGVFLTPGEAQHRPGVECQGDARQDRSIGVAS